MIYEFYCPICEKIESLQMTCEERFQKRKFEVIKNIWDYVEFLETGDILIESDYIPKVEPLPTLPVCVLNRKISENIGRIMGFDFIFWIRLKEIQKRKDIFRQISENFQFPICCDTPMKGIISNNPRGFYRKGRGWKEDGYCSGWNIDQIEYEMARRGEQVSDERFQ